MGVKLVGDILFYWDLYAVTLMSLLFQLEASLGGILSVKWFYVQLPPLLQPIMIFFTFLWSVYFLCKQVGLTPPRLFEVPVF